MTYIEIDSVRYPATIHGRQSDPEWDNRKSKAITLKMSHEEAMNTFVDGLEWSIVMITPVTVESLDDEGSTVTETVEQAEIYDNSEYCVAGPITDNRDGTVTVKMGKRTDGEMLAELTEVLSND